MSVILDECSSSFGDEEGFSNDEDPLERRVDRLEHSLFADCFVATACFGVNNSTTEILRRWRDRQKNIFSVLFIKLYYAGLGKMGAKILNVCPVLKPLARKMILAFMWTFRIS